MKELIMIENLEIIRELIKSKRITEDNIHRFDSILDTYSDELFTNNKEAEEWLLLNVGSIYDAINIVFSDYDIINMLHSYDNITESVLANVIMKLHMRITLKRYFTKRYSTDEVKEIVDNLLHYLRLPRVKVAKLATERHIIEFNKLDNGELMTMTINKDGFIITTTSSTDARGKKVSVSFETILKNKDMHKVVLSYL